MEGPKRPRPVPARHVPPRHVDDAPPDADFLDAMRGLEVRPLDGPPLEKPAAAKPVAGKRHRRPLRDEEVAQAVVPEDADLFRQAMSDLGIGESASGVSRSVSEPEPPPVSTPAKDATPGDSPSSGPSAGASRNRASDPVSAQDQALFLEAVDHLDPAVDKDQPPAPATPDAARDRSRHKPRRETLARKTLDRKASVVIDATLDLHRERQEAALERLRTFLVQSAIRRMTTVLVITGKGHHSEDGQGVLRRAVEAWLIQNGAPWVARYAEAPRHLGGSGAWVLTLQR